MVEIIKAGVADAGEILTVQRAAYVTEAQLYGTPSFSALSEPLDGVRARREGERVRVPGLGPRVVGGVRGVGEGGDCEVTRLVGAPDMPRRGSGAELIDAVEPTAPAEIRR